MFSRKKLIVGVFSLIIVVGSVTEADWKEDAEAIDVSGGEDHTLVLTKDKVAWACGPNGGYAFGYHYCGVLGTGETSWSHFETRLVRVDDGDMNTSSDYLANINDIDAGWMHSLALEKYDPCDPNFMGYVWSWGWNSEGQLGAGEGTPDSNVPVQVLRGEQPDDPCQPDGYLKYIIEISAGRSGEFSLAADANGYAYAWGMNQEGQLGNDESGSGERELTPVFVLRGEQQPEDPCNPDPNLTRIVAVSAGADHSMALEKLDPDDPNLNGCVYTWGNNRWPGDGENYQSGLGKLGNGTDDPCRPMPVRVLSGHQHPNDPNQPFLNHIVAVSAGWNHCMALEKDDPFDPNMFNPTYKGRVYTWGSNGQGYGDGQEPCSIGGRLGDGTYNDSNTPVLVLSGEQDPNNNEPNSYLEHIIAISAGEAHSMALDVNGTVYCWGDNYHGQLGNDSNVASTTPVRVVNPDDPNLPLENIVAISAGHWHSIAVDANGTIWTWGKAKEGRLAKANNTNDSSIPHPIGIVYNETQHTFQFAIQNAINQADNNDVLEASQSRYWENVNFLDKSITLRSTNPDNWKTVNNTIIDGSYNTEGDEDPCFYAVNLNDGSGSTLAGFTISDANRGGAYCKDIFSINITDCKFQNNSFDGMYLKNASVDITNCVIENNGHSEALDFYGIYCQTNSDANIIDCNISDNNDGGIYCDNSALTVGNSIIQDNGEYGIQAISNSDLTIDGSLIEANARSGLYAHNGCDFVLRRSVVRDNGWDGVDLEFNNAEIVMNNWIHNNGTIHESYRSGIWLLNNQLSVALVRNNTICGNPTYGIEVGDAVTDPNILNCIIYGNGSGDLHRDSGAFATVNYSSLQSVWGGTGNITGDPCFVDGDANDFHLDANSLCIDAGDPNFWPDPNETDIDGEDRIVDGDANGTEIVDMGADEFYWSAADYSGDGIVNFIDYAMLTSYWQDAGIDYNDVFAFGDSNSVSLEEFCDEWLWEAGWLSGSMPLMGGRSGKGMVEGLRLEVGLSGLAAAEREPRIGDAVDVEELLDWLAEIWLDPEVRKSLDADVWLKLYESLKEL